MTHTACVPQHDRLQHRRRGAGASARYEARNGDVYTLKPRQGGGVTVEVGGPHTGELVLMATRLRLAGVTRDQLTQAHARVRHRLAAGAEHARLEKMAGKLQSGGNVGLRDRGLLALRAAPGP